MKLAVDRALEGEKYLIVLYVDPDLGHVRIVQIEKPVNGLGFNIVGGEVDHQGTLSG